MEKTLNIPYLTLKREIDAATAEVKSGDARSIREGMRFLILAEFILDTVDGFDKLVAADEKQEAEFLTAKK